MPATMTDVSRRLSMPVPEQCSDHYAAGWAYADWFVSRDGDLDADAPAGWHEEKAVGFWDRLKAERDARVAC